VNVATFRYDAVCDQMSDVTSRLSAASAQLAGRQGQVAELQGAVAAMHARVASADAAAAQAGAEMSEIQGAVVAMRARVASAEAATVQAVAERDQDVMSATSRAQHLNAQLISVTQQLEAATRKVAELQSLSQGLSSSEETGLEHLVVIVENVTAEVSW
jgi:chromosome segregation ATPase